MTNDTDSLCVCVCIKNIKNNHRDKYQPGGTPDVTGNLEDK